MEESNPIHSGHAGDGADPEPALTYYCPGCGSSIPLAEAPTGGLVQCPACGAQFFAVAGGEGDDEAEADRRAREEAEEKFSRETEFDANRIKQLTVLRRSLIRTRSYFIMGAAVCAAAAFKLVWEAGKRFPAARAAAAAKHAFFSAYALPLALVFTGIAACLGCVYFIGRVRRADRELAVPLQTDPLTPPDFSTLSDGSQHWRKLEQMAGRQDNGNGASLDERS